MESEFDLAGLESADRSLKRSSLYVVLAVIVGLGVTLIPTEVWGFHFVASTGISTSQDQGLVFGGAMLAFAIVYLSLLIPGFLPGARRIQVDASGVRLFLKGNRVHRYSWEDPRSRFLLNDYGAHPSVAAQGTAYSLRGVHLWGRRSLLSKEAFVVLLDTVRERQLIKSQYVGSPNWYPHPPMIYRVQGRPPGSAPWNVPTMVTSSPDPHKPQ